MDEVLETTQQTEVIIDMLWIVHMLMSFTTAFYREADIVTDLKEIAFKYLKENFFIDVITTFPTLITWYTIPSLYYLKLLRFYYMSRSTQIIKNQIL